MKKLISLFLALLILTSVCPVFAEYTDAETIAAVQEVLADAGIYKGNISGIKGNATEAAIRTYQQKNGLKVNGQIDDDLLDSLGLLSDEVILVSKITLNEESVSLSKGGNVTLTATVEPKNARNKKVEWSSTDETVATVKDGKVTAKANGTCDIICRAKDDSGIEAVCHVAVIVMVTSVTTTQNQKVTIPYEGSVELTATAKPTDATNTMLKWSSSDESVCVVDENGKVTSVGSGDCEIECSTTDGSKKSLKFQIHVPIFDTLEATYTIIEKGWNLIPIDLHGASAGSITHSISSEKYFMYYFDNEGIHVYPIAEGNAQISFTSKLNKQDKMIVSVVVEESATYIDEEEPLSIIVTLDQYEVMAGDTYNMRYRIFGGTPPYTIVGITNKIWNTYNTGGAVPFDQKTKDTPIGKVTYKAEQVYNNQYFRWKVTASDALGSIASGISNRIFAKGLKVEFDKDYYAVSKSQPYELKYSIIGGSGKYKATIYWTEYFGDAFLPNNKQETITTGNTGVVLLEGINAEQISVRIEVEDIKNKNLIGLAETPVIVMTNNWDLAIEYDKDTVASGDFITAKVLLNNASIDKIKRATLYRYSYNADTGEKYTPFNNETITFSLINNEYIAKLEAKEHETMSLSVTLEDARWINSVCKTLIVIPND